MPTFPSLRDYVWGTIVLLALGGFIAWTLHVKHVQADKDAAAAAKAVAQHQVDVAHEQISLNNQAAAAKADREHLESGYAEYRRTHPLSPVRVCPRPSGGQVSPGVATARPGDTATSAGPDVGGSVPEGSTEQGTDISPELDTIVQSFAKLARLYRESQEQPQVK